ncbi:MAG: hypothetical protein ACRDTD_16100 [Pseudonocardiaceae bacterium]
MTGIGEWDPSPEAVRDAVASTGDPEIASLTASVDSYVLRPASLQGGQMQLFNVVLLNVPHPMGFLLAVDRSTGRAVVTSGRPDAVRQVVATDPGLGKPSAVWELIRVPPMDGDLLEAALAQGEDVSDPGASRRYEFRVRDRDTGAVQRWALLLSDRGSAWERVD